MSVVPWSPPGQIWGVFYSSLPPNERTCSFHQAFTLGMCMDLWVPVSSGIPILIYRWTVRLERPIIFAYCDLVTQSSWKICILLSPRRKVTPTPPIKISGDGRGFSFAEKRRGVPRGNPALLLEGANHRLHDDEEGRIQIIWVFSLFTLKLFTASYVA